MAREFTFHVSVRELQTGKWEVAMSEVPVRAFGTTRREAYDRFLAVYELYREYGEDWMAHVLAEKNEEYVDASTEMTGDPWSPDGAV
jgi:hypothetical protein